MTESTKPSPPARPLSILALLLILIGFGVEIAGVVSNNSALFFAGVILFIIALILFAFAWWMRPKTKTTPQK